MGLLCCSPPAGFAVAEGAPNVNGVVSFLSSLAAPKAGAGSVVCPKLKEGFAGAVLLEPSNVAELVLFPKLKSRLLED